MKKKKVLKLVLKGLKIALNVGLIATIVLLISPWILAYGSLLWNSDCSYRTLKGYSMTPTLKHGDTTLIKKGAGDIQVGDIISFEIDAIFGTTHRVIGVIHRVIDIQENPILTFKTKGDANKKPDRWRITADQVEGKVIDIVPTSLLLTPTALSLFILLPAITIIARAVYHASKKKILTKFDIFTTVLLSAIIALSGASLFEAIFYSMLY